MQPEESSPTATDVVPVFNTAEKSATFRKRRLSCPKHHLEEDAAKAAEAATNYGYDEEQGEQQQNPPPEEEEENDKAHTFRKRRLSLTLNKPQNGEAGAASDEEEESSSWGLRPSQRRRLSVASGASGSSATQGQQQQQPSTLTRHKSLTIHSSELLGGPLPPPSPAVQDMNILYRQQPAPPPQLSLDHPASGLQMPGNLTKKQQRRLLNPRWKKRHHPTDDSKLPFPKEIVGTYSCHGVEPIYGSEYDEQEEDNEIEEFDEGIEESLNEDTPAGVVNGDTTAIPLTKRDDTVAGDDLNKASLEQFATTNGEPELAPPTKPTMAAKINQDRGGIAFPYGNSRKTALFAVYDGHGQGGELVSQYALHEIQRRLERHASFKSDLETAFKETFVSVDSDLREEPIIEPFYAGTTACVALLSDSKLTLANAGDSRAVLAQRTKNGEVTTCTALDLTQDQNPDSPAEQARIESMGGFVSGPPGPGLSSRVWLDSDLTQIGLAMARSIGDHAIAEVGVIAEPVVTSRTLEPQDDFMILASDGVWEFLSSQNAVDIVAEHLESRGATKACQALIEAAASRWHDEEGEYRDDITAIVVRLPNLWDSAASTTQ